MSNFVEVQTPEEASHVLIIENKFPNSIRVTEGKTYELMYGFMGIKVDYGDGKEELDEFHVIEDDGVRGVGFMWVGEKKWLLEV